MAIAATTAHTNLFISVTPFHQETIRITDVKWVVKIVTIGYEALITSRHVKL